MFLSENGWQLPVGIALIVVAALCLLGIIALLIVYKVLTKKDKKEIKKDEALLAIGGTDNLIEKSINGSRISLKLKDYDLINKGKLLSSGVDSFIRMSDKLILVVKGDAKKVYSDLFGKQ